MFTGRQIAISIPAAELRRVKRPASVFPVDALDGAPLSIALRRALNLVRHHCAAMDEQPLVVVRPEMFPEGASLAWLRERIAGVEEHVSISDGSVVKAIPGLRNHLFFCGLSTELGETRFSGLAERATETFLPFKTQINSARAVRGRHHSVHLPTTALPAIPGEDPFEVELERFYLNPWSFEDSIGRMALFGRQPLRNAFGFRQLTIVPTVEAALADPAYRLRLAQLVSTHYFNPEAGLILQTPLAFLAKPEEEDDDASLKRLLAALLDTPTAIPRQPASNIFVARRRIPPKLVSVAGANTTLILSDANALWSYAPEEYRAFSSILILARPGHSYRTQFYGMAQELIGRDHVVEWLTRI